MTFRLRDAQQAALAQSHAVEAASAKLGAKGFTTQRGAGAGELLAYDARGKCSRFWFGSSGRLVQLSSPLGRTHRFGYDDQRVSTIAEPNGLVTTVAYGPHGLPVSVARGEQTRWSFEWDERGDPTRVIEPDGNAWEASYSADGQLTSTSKGGSTRVSVEYSEQGLPVALLEATGARTVFEYGDWDRPDRTRRANGELEEIARNAAGQVVSATQDGAKWFDAEYDPQGRVSAIRYADGHFVEFEYNAAGQVVSAKNPNSLVQRSYDDAGRLLTERQGDALFSFAYDASGCLIELEIPSGERLRYTYDDDARLIGVSDWHGQAHRITHARDESAVEHQFPNGLACRRELSQRGSVAELILKRTLDGATLGRLGFDYTEADRVSECRDSEIGARRFAYDPSGQLLQVRSPSGAYDETYAYDGSGNRLQANGVAIANNAVNQVVACGPLSFTYDGRGNLATESGALGTTEYRYDGQNQLVEVLSPGKPSIRYEYDAFGRRIRKLVGDRQTRFFWAGDQLLGELVEQAGEQERRDYLFVPGASTPLSARVNGAVFQYHADHNGTPRWLTDARGNVVWSGASFAFGHVEVLRSKLRQPFRFPGQYFDEETGLHYNRSRYYSPHLGRYLTRDPASFVAGVNFYTYAENDPVNGKDPLGLFSWGAAALAVGGIVIGAVAIAVFLPAIAVTAAGMAAVAGVVAGAALVGGSVAVLATDVATDGCVPCMRDAFVKGSLEGAKIGFDVALMVLTMGAGGGLALAGRGVMAATAVTRGITAAAMAAAAAAGIVSMTGGGSGSGGSGDGGGGDDEKEARRKADQQRKAEKRQADQLNKRAKSGDKEATLEQNRIKAKQQRDAGNTGSAEGYEAENKVIQEEGDNVVEAGREVKYPDPKNPGKTISSDIDMETKTNVTQIKSGTEMPSRTQADCTRLRAAETGKQPEVIYDPAKMPPEQVEAFKADNPDFIVTPRNLR